MLNLQINDPELEQNLRQAYGNDNQSIIEAFSQFVKQQRIKQDITVSKEQAINAEVIELDEMVAPICARYK